MLCRCFTSLKINYESNAHIHGYVRSCGAQILNCSSKSEHRKRRNKKNEKKKENLSHNDFFLNFRSLEKRSSFTSIKPEFFPAFAQSPRNKKISHTLLSQRHLSKDAIKLYFKPKFKKSDPRKRIYGQCFAENE